MIYKRSNQSGFISTKVSMIVGSILAATAVGASAFIGVNAPTLNSATESAPGVCIEAWWADNEDIYSKRCGGTPDSGVIKPPTEVEPPVIVDPDTEKTTLIYRCDSEETGALHFSAVADDAVITINGGEYNDQIIEDEYDEITLAPGIVYEASLEGEFVELTGRKRDIIGPFSSSIIPLKQEQLSSDSETLNYYSGVTNCLREIKTIGLNSDLRTMRELGVNLEKVPKSIPSTIVSLYSAFYLNEKFNDPNIVSWDVSNVSNLEVTFAYATSFNQPIGEWNTESLESLNETFALASSFNQPLNNWKVSNVSEFYHTFAGASSFNQPLNKWIVSDGVYFVGMFNSASSFSQDLSKWTLNPDANGEDFEIDSGLTPEQLPKFSSN